MGSRRRAFSSARGAMSFGVAIEFELRDAAPGMPVHPEVLEFQPRCVVSAQDESTKVVSALLIVPSLAVPSGRTEVDPGLLDRVTVEGPGRIVGRSQPLWARPPTALFRRDGAVEVPPFASRTLPLGGRAFLPYVPDALRGAGAVHSGYGSIAEQAYERGSLSGRSVFGGALFLAFADGLAEWYQLVAKYWAVAPDAWRHEVVSLTPADTAESSPRVYWSADPVF